MNVDVVDRTALTPAFLILPMAMDSPTARMLLLAIGLQESSFTARRQMGGGPARGFWQNERGGGVKGVVTNKSTLAHCRNLTLARQVRFDIDAIYNALEHDDVLAAGVARLILFADPRPLPPMDDPALTWACYLRNWRPGKPRPDDWPKNHAAALAYIHTPPNASKGHP